jgi:hypothetical protein
MKRAKIVIFKFIQKYSTINNHINHLSNIIVNTSKMYEYMPNKIKLSEKKIQNIKDFEKNVLNLNFKDKSILLSVFDINESLKLSIIGGPLFSTIINTHIISNSPNTKLSKYIIII